MQEATEFVLVRAVRKYRSQPATRAAGARLITLPIVAGLALATSRIIIEKYGLMAYGVFALIIALPTLLPSRDFGLGAKVTDVVARRHLIETEQVGATIGLAMRKIARFAALGIALLVFLQVVVGWSRILGNATLGMPDTAITIAFAVFLLGLPAGVSDGIFGGARRQDLIAVQGVALTLTICLGVAVTALLDWPLWVAIVSSTTFNCLVQWGALYFALGYIGVPRRPLLSWRTRVTHDISFRTWAIPMFVISTAGAVAYQADRIVLSHVSGVAAVAQYSVAAMAFFPMLSVASSAGNTLWGKFAADRETGGIHGQRFWRTVAGFAGVGLAEACLLMILAPWAVELLLRVTVPFGVYAAFGLLALVQTCGLPFSMLLTDPWGLRRQALLFTAMVIANIVLSIFWARTMGAAGPILASAITYSALVLFPSMLLVRRYTSPRLQGSGHR